MHLAGVKSLACLWKLLRFVKPYRSRLVLGILTVFAAATCPELYECSSWTELKPRPIPS